MMKNKVIVEYALRLRSQIADIKEVMLNIRRGYASQDTSEENTAYIVLKDKLEELEIAYNRFLETPVNGTGDF